VIFYLWRSRKLDKSALPGGDDPGHELNLS